MQRSAINTIMRNADAFIRSHGYVLPPFAYWPPESWRARGGDVQEIIDCHLGWDVTDFGAGDFERRGLFLFTVRNGLPGNPNTRQYAEKIMVVGDGQVTPLHFHWLKTEDIINRGGGNLVVQLYRCNADESVDQQHDVVVSTDGVRRVVAAGATITLTPGESVTLVPGIYHAFWGEGGSVLVGEVSSVNDDASDNRFAEPIGRFPAIEEDEAPLYLLCTDYDKFR
jgi:D-lyxose ketol-isomerase